MRARSTSTEIQLTDRGCRRHCWCELPSFVHAKCLISASCINTSFVHAKCLISTSCINASFVHAKCLIFDTKLAISAKFFRFSGDDSAHLRLTSPNVAHYAVALVVVCFALIHLAGVKPRVGPAAAVLPGAYTPPLLCDMVHCYCCLMYAAATATFLCWLAAAPPPPPPSSSSLLLLPATACCVLRSADCILVLPLLVTNDCVHNCDVPLYR